MPSSFKVDSILEQRQSYAGDDDHWTLKKDEWDLLVEIPAQLDNTEDTSNEDGQGGESKSY